jgi:hypothetical protein
MLSKYLTAQRLCESGKPAWRRGKVAISGRYITCRYFAVMAALLLAACTAPRPPLVVTDPDPSVKIPAIQKAVREKNRAAIPQLIKDLDNDDAAVRMYANHALEEMTGERFGFRYFAGEEERAVIVRKWRDWSLNPSSAGPEVAPVGNASVAP